MKYLTLLIFMPSIACSSNAPITAVDYESVHSVYQSHSCSNEATQSAMDTCSKLSLEKKTLIMNKLIKQLVDSKSGQSVYINKAQSNWINFTQSSCELENSDSKDRTGYFSIYTACIEGKTLERISYIQWQLNNI